MLPALTIYIGIAIIFALRHRTVCIPLEHASHETLRKRAGLLGVRSSVFTGDNAALEKPIWRRGWHRCECTRPDCSTYHQSSSLFVLPPVARVAVSSLWPILVVVVVMRTIFTDHRTI